MSVGILDLPQQHSARLKAILIFNSCGRQFCYVCGQKWKTCSCDRWQEEMLYDVANGAMNDEIAPNAGVEARRLAFDRIVGELRDHEDIGCEHQRNSQWKWRDQGSMQCEVCNHVLPLYIFVCRNCHIRACYRCRRHRLR